MSLEKIVNTLKTPKEEKSAISFNIPVSLKKQLVDLAKENGFTVNAFLVEMIDEVLNGELKEKKNLEMVEKLEKLYARKAELESVYGHTEDIREFHEVMSDGRKYKSEYEGILHMIDLLKD